MRGAADRAGRALNEPRRQQPRLGREKGVLLPVELLPQGDELRVQRRKPLLGFAGAGKGGAHPLEPPAQALGLQQGGLGFPQGGAAFGQPLLAPGQPLAAAL